MGHANSSTVACPQLHLFWDPSPSLVFCDMSQNAESKGFNAWDDGRASPRTPDRPRSHGSSTVPTRCLHLTAIKQSTCLISLSQNARLLGLGVRDGPRGDFRRVGVDFRPISAGQLVRRESDPKDQPLLMRVTLGSNGSELVIAPSYPCRWDTHFRVRTKPPLGCQ